MYRVPFSWSPITPARQLGVRATINVARYTARGAMRPNFAKLPECLQRRSVLLNANASGVSCAPAHGSALLAHAGSGLADTVDHYPAHATAHTRLRDCAVPLMHRRNRHCLRSGSERQPENSKSYYSDHCFLVFGRKL